MNKKRTMDKKKKEVEKEYKMWNNRKRKTNTKE
jgi:hypothetical protein